MSFSNNPYQSPQSLTPGPSHYPPASPNQAATALAITSLVLGVVGFTSGCCCLLVPVPLLAIIVGVIALTQKPDPTAKNLAIAGIVCGAFSLVVFAVVMFLGVANAVVNDLQPPR